MSGAIRKTFFIDARLPGQVFRDPYQLGFLFTDSALVSAPELTDVLRLLGDRFEDEGIRGEVIDDLRADQDTQKLPSLELDSAVGRKELRSWLTGVSPGRIEPLYVDGRVIAFSGGSGSWGVWFDQDRELAVLGVPVRELGEVRDALARQVGWPWYEASEVAELLGPSFYPKRVPDALTQEIRRSYAIARR